MNPVKRPKKLVLNKETIRTLSDDSLNGVRGGEAILSITGCPGKCSGAASCRQNSGCPCNAQ